MIKGYDYQSDFARKYVAEGCIRGRAEGRIEGRAEGRIEGRFEGRIEGRTEGLLEGLTKGRTEGRAEGRIEQAARALLAVCRVRGMPLTSALRERILSQKEPEQLERWLEKAVVAASVAEIIDEPS